MEELRGFRYQTGEIKTIAEKMRETGCVEADIDDVRELDEVAADLKPYGYTAVGEIDVSNPTHIDLDAHPDYYGRMTFTHKDTESQLYYIDFFLIEEDEESYDEIYYG